MARFPETGLVQPGACAWACSGQSLCDFYSSAACPARRAVTLHSVATTNHQAERHGARRADGFARRSWTTGYPDGESQSGYLCWRECRSHLRDLPPDRAAGTQLSSGLTRR